MCLPALLPLVGGTATAAGATAAAATTGLTLQGIGTALAVGGSIAQGISSYKAAKTNAALVGQQRDTDRLLTAQKELRTRRKFKTEMRRQVAELADRGVSIDSPSAILLGQEAASEMSFQSQSVRQDGLARDQELSAQQSAYRSQAMSSLLKGGMGAAGTLLTAAPDLWPNLGDAA
ncbi:hypothetical protein [Roseobacter sp. TSBP12]|uniref:hypothetical protein n=1 Tax=Roseobacter sp. TSBP12 TaxID=1236613 RepID=UPI00125F6EA6|nr:hypothetical protein [Roseobacter sp. TSBP12]